MFALCLDLLVEIDSPAGNLWQRSHPLDSPTNATIENQFNLAAIKAEAQEGGAEQEEKVHSDAFIVISSSSGWSHFRDLLFCCSADFLFTDLANRIHLLTAVQHRRKQRCPA